MARTTPPLRPWKGTFCPGVNVSGWADANTSLRRLTIACVHDEACTCAEPSYVRELVNVTLEGLACYACEPRRPPACTEAQDQCTPEACECADPSTHVKQAATTVDGTPCHYCESVHGLGGGLGLQELAIVAMVVSLVLACQFLGRRPQPGGPKGSLRLARRQGGRTWAIRVQQEPLRFHEEVLLSIWKTFDALVDGLWEVLTTAWSMLGSACGYLATSAASAWDAASSCGRREPRGCEGDGPRAASSKAVPAAKAERISPPKAEAIDASSDAAGARRRTRRKDVVGTPRTPTPAPSTPPAPRAEAARFMKAAPPRPLAPRASDATAAPLGRAATAGPLETAGPAAAGQVAAAGGKAQRPPSATPPAAAAPAAAAAAAAPAAAPPREALANEGRPAKRDAQEPAPVAIATAAAAPGAPTAMAECLGACSSSAGAGRVTATCPDEAGPGRPAALDRSESEGNGDSPSDTRRATALERFQAVVSAGPRFVEVRTFLAEPELQVVLRRTVSDSNLERYA